MKLSELLQRLEVVKVVGDTNVDIKGVAHDSRKVSPGYLFVCIEGFKSDGHDYIPSAVAAGAEAILVQKPVPGLENLPCIQVEDTRRALALISLAFYGNPAGKMNLVGVTGTNGKTTTTHLIKAILEEEGNKVGLIGTIQNVIDGKVYPVSNTTPLPLELQELLSEMQKAQTEYAVMEVSSHALDLGRVEGIEFDVAVFTNITQDHLDYHETMENYLQAKVKLFASLDKNGNKRHTKYGIINIDDPQAEYIIQRSGGEVVTYGINREAHVKADNVQIKVNGVSFDVTYPQGQVHLDLKMTGMFSVYNALAAFAVGLVEQVPVVKIKHALEAVKGVAGRFELVDEGQEFAVIVDYAHTPDSLENVLKTAQEFVEGRVISVFGCGGDRDKTKRPIMGAVSGKLADYTIVTSDNPRSEDPAVIVQEVAAGVQQVADPAQYTVIVDRQQAIRQAIAMAQKGDLVLIAGKGHETYQILKDTTIHFDDREVASAALKEQK